MHSQSSSSAYSKKNKIESLTQFDKLEKNDRDTSKDKKLAFAVFAAPLTGKKPNVSLGNLLNISVTV
jgi:hypothetical protein